MGSDYSHQEYVELASVVKEGFRKVLGCLITRDYLQERFGCMSPFIPKHYRAGMGLCRNETKGRILNQFLKRSVALTGLSTNLWSSDFYFKPPCTTFRYHTDIITDRSGWDLNI